MSNLNDFVIEDSVLKKYVGPGGDAVIPDGVTSICNFAFGWCKSLTSVTIPNSVTRIGDSAFYGCSSLTSVVIPDSVTSIGGSAFAACSSLTSVTIGNGVTSIGNGAFSDCSSLTSVNITDIAAWCSIRFEGNNSNPLRYAHKLYLNGERMTDLIVPVSVTSIGNSAFEHCGRLKSVTIPDSVTSIGDSAFCLCRSLTSVTIGNGVTSIGSSAFAYCDKLTSVTIGDRVTNIGKSAFSGCIRLTNMMIPASVRAIRKDAFERTCITAFKVSPLSKKFQAVNGIILSKDGKKLIAYPPKADPAICRLPETVEEIPAYPFGYGGREQWIEIPRSVKKMAKTKYSNKYVFIYSAALIDSQPNPVFLGDISVVEPKAKNKLVGNFLHAVECGRPEIEPYKASYAEHIRKDPKSYVEWASKNETLFHFFIQEKLIPKNWVENVLVELEQKNRSDLKAELLTYQQENFPKKGKDSFSLSDDDPELKRRMEMDKRREEIKNQKGIQGIAFVATGDLARFGDYNEYTGAVDRSDLKRFIEARGGFLRSAVSSKTDYLICNNPDSKSEKVQKARKLGVTIIDEATFMKMAQETE